MTKEKSTVDSGMLLIVEMCLSLFGQNQVTKDIESTKEESAADSGMF